ncbi:MAG: AI-2E family transporter [Anaerolineales bacterium]|nr:AI-2E family transporter [Anaerolineales bacterium]
MNEIRPRWSPHAKLTVVLLLLSLGVFLLYRFSAVIEPMIVAFILAYIISPMANWLQERIKVGRGLATLLAYLLLLAILAAIPMVVIPPLTAQSTGLNLDIQRILVEVESLLGNRYIIAGRVIDVDAIFQTVIGSVQGVLEPVFGHTLEFAVEFISSLVWVIFIAVVSFYLAKDSAIFRQWLEDITPPAYKQDYLLLRSEIGKIWEAFFRGQLALALIVATIFTIVGLIIGMPFALAMGVLAGLLEFLPSVGHGIWMTIAALLAFFAGSTWLPIPKWAFALLVIGLHLFFQQFDLNYLIPRIIGRRVHLPPLVVILGIVSGALLAGVLGILLAAPTIASARVLGRYVYANLFDQEPFPYTIAPPLPPPNPRWWRKTSGEQAADAAEQM